MLRTAMMALGAAREAAAAAAAVVAAVTAAIHAAQAPPFIMPRTLAGCAWEQRRGSVDAADGDDGTRSGARGGGGSSNSDGGGEGPQQ